MTARSFADDVRSRTDAQLRRLVLRRPDLARPAPADLTGLAARAATRPSVQRAIEALEADTLRVLEAVLVADDKSAAGLLGVAQKTVAPQLRSLQELGLLWRSSTGLTPARAVAEVLPEPAHLGPTARELGVRPPADIAATIEQCSDATRGALGRLRWAGPRVTFSSNGARAVRDELLEASLAASVAEDTAVLPREVGLALRDGRLYEDALSRPDAASAALDPAAVDAAGGSAAYDLLVRVEELADLWSSERPRVLRSGGLGVKDHRAATTALEVSPEIAAFVIEIAAASGLVGRTVDAVPVFLPTAEYDEWLDAEPAHRWRLLAQTWWTTLRAPSLCTDADQPGGPLNVLAPEATWPLLRTRRHEVLGVLAALKPGRPATLEEVGELLRWHLPMRLPRSAPTRAAIVLREAEWLGLVATGAVTSAGRALVGGTEPAPALPTPIDELLVQADLTAVAPGALSDDLRRFMHRAAEVESRGAATVYRFTPTSVRTVLDGGADADDVLERLRGASRTPLPQPLEYLVGDVARRHGQTRIGAAGCYLRSDDEASLQAILGDRSLAPLQLRRIAPTVLVSPAPATTVLEMLRDHRHTPVAESATGTVVGTGPGKDRAPTPRAPQAVQVSLVDEPLAERLVAAMRAGERDRPEPAAGPRIPSTEPSVTRSLLQEAVGSSARVWIGYAEPSGELRRGLFRPRRIEGGRVSGLISPNEQDPEHPRTFSIHRITGIVEVA
ncbi:helicase-associated domain-containing protein [Allobranchiibius huperziae]|uniref:Helicase XPB/Ssl2 N-terminal domain-containing protein n=1 Tax=Allobranchiibius huperziae TaxID=1874116 RepID=A0A853D9B9_9MICO|nr:helicase-associated domain-containing protein [Allobranchiibius huperziae]NYJ73558.1 hypothetical protein [Allobranchiibius huperziae]